MKARLKSKEELARENAALRRELSRLEVFRTLAYRDPLTALWNRRYFDERLEEEMSRAARAPGRSFAVMMVDVNDLKKVNDVQGHAAGDKALQWVARFLRDTLRAHDVVCRLGGDEFGVLFPDLREGERAPLLARLRRALEEANRRVRREPSVGLSFGIACYPDDGREAQELIGAADAAMYGDKRRQKLGPDAGGAMERATVSIPRVSAALD